MTLQATPFNRASELALSIYAKTLDAVRADRLVEAAVQRLGDTLFVQDKHIDLSAYDRVWIAGAGKASVSMASALSTILGDRLAGGVIVTKSGHASPVSGLEVLEAAHPVPDASSLTAGEKLLSFAESVGEHDLVLFLLSGGASALIEAPIPGVTLDDLQALNQRLLASGLSIREMNVERSKVSRIKGGGLGKAFMPATVIALVLSDVVGNDLSAIGSGPLIGGGLRPPIEHFVIGSISLAVHAAADAAKEAGLLALPYGDPIVGEARLAARKICRHASEFGRMDSCMIFGGEPTVKIRGAGLGGRCQEMAVGAAELIAKMPGTCFLAGSTDGTDGPTDVAGGMVDPSSIERATAGGLSIKRALATNDSNPWLAASGGLIVTGPTGSNVNDIVLVVNAF